MKTSSELVKAVESFKSGNKESFNELYRLSNKYLFVCAKHILKDEQAAEDILQETYLEVSKHIHQLKDTQNFLGWAATIANRKSYAYLKKNKEMLLESVNEEENPWDEVADSDAFIPETILQDKEKQRLIKEIIDNLTDMQRLCLIGFYYNEEKQEKIAEDLQIPVSTVKSHLNRAKAKIKEAVIELDEKKGTRLYAVAPFMLLLCQEEVRACEISTVMGSQLLEEVMMENGSTAIKSAAKVTGKGASTALKTKVAMGAIGVITSVGIIAGVGALQDKPAQTANEVVQTQEQETSDSEEVEDIAESNAAVESNATIENEDEKENEEIVVESTVDENTHVSEITALSTDIGIGSSNGGIIPIKRDGLWGALNYNGEEVVPCTYMGFHRAPDVNGNFVLTNSTFEEYTIDFDGEEISGETEIKIYTLFNAKGEVIYEGENQVYPAGNMYILFPDEPDENGFVSVAYYYLDGTLALSAPCESSVLEANSFYEGISTIYSIGADDLEQIGTVTEDGNVVWKTVDRTLDNKESEETPAVSSAGGSMAGDSVLVPRQPVNTVNNGYYITRNYYMESGLTEIYTENGSKIGTMNIYHCANDNENGFIYDQKIYNESIQFRSYYRNGDFYYHYGSKAVIRTGEKDVLVDFALYPNMTSENADSRIAVASYDQIYLNDETYWLVNDGGKWGYVDHDGVIMAMYDKATDFYEGVAVVIENGQAYFINEQLEKIEELGEAVDTFNSKDLFAVQKGNEYVMYKYNK